MCPSRGEIAELRFGELMQAQSEKWSIDPELKYINGKWVFVNFHKSLKDDPQDRENLIDQLLMQRCDLDSSKR